MSKKIKKQKTHRYLKQYVTVWLSKTATYLIHSWAGKQMPFIDVGVHSPLEKLYKSLGAQLCREPSNLLTSSLPEKFAMLSPEWQAQKVGCRKREVLQSNQSNSYCFNQSFTKDWVHLKLLCNFKLGTNENMYLYSSISSKDFRVAHSKRVSKRIIKSE